jgi:hypothetical protein
MFGNDGCWFGGGTGGIAWLLSAPRRCLAGGGAGLIAAAGVSGTTMFGTARLDNDRFGADMIGMDAVSGSMGSSRTTGTGAVIGSRSGRAMGMECMGGRAIGIDGIGGRAGGGAD